MRTEKEVKDKILDLQDRFFEDENSTLSLARLRATIKVLKWFLGGDWKEINRRKSSHRGARLKQNE